MIANLGYICLLLSAGLTAIIAIWAPLQNPKITPHKIAIIESLSVVQAILVLTAFLVLVYAYSISDFSIMSVALNSHTSTPFFYKISSVWGNHEGSMLLWLLVLSGFTAVFAVSTMQQRLFKIRVLTSQAWIGLGFHLFILLISNPFIKFETIPLNGRGLNPILQDPALAFHPPILYIGYVGLSIAFSFAMAGLWQKNIDQVWAKLLKPWCLIAWSFLTFGVTLGSLWAYYELGWGGWWFWDPVENAALMPWLLATALIHSLSLIEKQNAFKLLTTFLAIMSFGFSLIGTFLVRSGILTSIHSFAVAPARGQFLLLLIMLILGYGLTLFLIQARFLKSPIFATPLSLPGTLIFSTLILSLLTATVFLGTLYPLLLESITGQQLSVGAPYFNQTFVPLAFPLIVVMGFASQLSWQGDTLYAISRKLQIAFITTMITALIVGYWQKGGPILSIASLSAAIWLFIATLSGVWDTFKEVKYLPLTYTGMATAHIGIALVIMGMTVDIFWKTEKTQIVSPGDQIEIAGYTLILKKVSLMPGQNYQAEKAILHLFKDGQFQGILNPEKRYYPLHQVIATETSIKTRKFSDLYIALGEFQGCNRWSMRFYWHPMVNLIWLGGAFCTLGGLLAFVSRLRRKVAV
ncbi:MAG: heme lyase CcmF/NrfE family subunit [Alphaproteobacteria bacterium]|nr:heme lyase CcmF/NrfE family subunit [Alphaproteobacteria bacterium]